MANGSASGCPAGRRMWWDSFGRGCSECHPLVVTVWTLEADDISWAAELMDNRRKDYARYSPVFWRPRSGITSRHAGFLHHQAQTPSNVGLRTDHGFIIAQQRQDEGFVDDFAVDAEGTWAATGRELLHGAWNQLVVRGVTVMRVVTAKADQAKVEMLVGGGLRLAEQWWVKPLETTGPGAAPGRTSGTSFSGILGPAPPVYDPGGPVLLADRVTDDVDLTVLEREAAAMGAVLAVVPTKPAAEREQQLHQRSWTVASQWYVGRPEMSLSR